MDTRWGRKVGRYMRGGRARLLVWDDVKASRLSIQKLDGVGGGLEDGGPKWEDSGGQTGEGVMAQ